MLNDPIAVVLAVTRVLEHLGVRYVLGGSLASAAHGKVRFTADADLVADLGLDRDSMTKMAATLGVADLLARALRAAA